MKKQTGHEWSLHFNIEVSDPKGWQNFKQFSTELITKDEFVNRAAASDVQATFATTRRDAAKFLKKM